MSRHQVPGRLMLAVVAFTLVSAPALACAAIVVPEPTTLSIVGAAIAGLVAAYRMRRDG